MLGVLGKGQLVAVARTLLLAGLCCWLRGKHFLVRKEAKTASPAPCLSGWAWLGHGLRRNSPPCCFSLFGGKYQLVWQRRGRRQPGSVSPRHGSGSPRCSVPGAAGEAWPAPCGLALLLPPRLAVALPPPPRPRWCGSSLGGCRSGSSARPGREPAREAAWERRNLLCCPS